MSYAKIIIEREYMCLELSNADSLVNFLALNAVKPRRFPRILPLSTLWVFEDTVLVLSILIKITATATQLQRTVLKYFVLFKDVTHSLEPCETPNNSASHQALNYVQRS